jgi:hypothetical protein
MKKKRSFVFIKKNKLKKTRHLKVRKIQTEKKNSKKKKKVERLKPLKFITCSSKKVEYVEKNIWQAKKKTKQAIKKKTKKIKIERGIYNQRNIKFKNRYKQEIQQHIFLPLVEQKKQKKRKNTIKKAQFAFCRQRHLNNSTKKPPQNK